MSNKYPGMAEVSCSEDLVKKELRIYGRGFQNAELVVDCFKKYEDGFLVPKVWAHEKGLLGSSNDNRPSIEFQWPDSDFKPRHNQADVVSTCTKYLRNNVSGRMAAPTGYGKTFCALQIAKRLKTNVLYIAHKLDILKQVKQTSKKLFNIPSCGQIKSGKQVDTSKIITVCSMQTLAKVVVDNPEWLSSFGLLILDEVHRCPCASYVTSMQKLNPTYTLGISATFRRSDGLEGVWESFLGKLITEGKLDNPRIPKLETPVIEGTGLSNSSFYDFKTGDLSHVKAVTKIAENDIYNRWLALRIAKLLSEGRKPIVCTDRKQQLEDLQIMLHDLGVKSVGIYAAGKHRGVMTPEEVKLAYCNEHKKIARKDYKTKIEQEKGKYTPKKFNDLYEEPSPNDQELKEFYQTFAGNTIKEADLVEAMKKDVVLATTKKVGEGFDFSNFLGDEADDYQEPDTIIITSMTKDSTQVIGRISRQKESKLSLIHI